MTPADPSAAASRAADVRVEPVDPAAPEAVAAVRAYLRELATRFSTSDDPDEALAPGDLARLRPPTGAFLLLRSAGEPVGCGGVRRLAPGVAEIKRMWVRPDRRGAGLARLLLAALEAAALELGCDRAVLDTDPELHEAVVLYRRAGYEPIARYNDNPSAGLFFAKTLTPSR